MADLTFETKIDFGNFGGNKKLTFTSWNGNAPRYDIRDWYDDKAGKGITLDKDELETLYGLLVAMFETTVETKEETTEDENPWDIEETTEEVTEEATEEVKDDTETQVSLVDEDDVTEEIEEDNEEYPKAIQKIFDTLDELFKGLEIEKAYGKMPFADGDRLQYCVKKGDFPEYEKTLEKLKLNHFITDKGNLYIYTL